MFTIGDKVFYASFDTKTIQVSCPDCGGDRFVVVTYHDGTSVKVDCQGCYPGGIDKPTGTIPQYIKTAIAIPHTITGVSQRRVGEVEYYFDHNYCDTNGQRTFATEEEALDCANSLKHDAEAEDNARKMVKTQQHKSYAWNASYHRKCAERATSDLKYHTEKAQLMASKAKDYHEHYPL